MWNLIQIQYICLHTNLKNNSKQNEPFSLSFLIVKIGSIAYQLQIDEAAKCMFYKKPSYQYKLMKL